MKKLTAPLAAVMLVIALSLSLAAPASASNPNVNGKVITASGQPLKVRSGPGTSYPILGTVGSGTIIQFNCYENGTIATGPYGQESVWDRLDTGGFVSDAWIYTGHNSAVVPPCGPGGAGCYGASCVGKNPGTEGCLADAAIVTQYYGTPDIPILEPAGQTRRTSGDVVELHSNACNAAWFDVYGTVDPQDGDLAKLSAWNPKGPSQHFTYFINGSGKMIGGDSNMVNDGIGAIACVGAQVYYVPGNVEVYYQWQLMLCR